MSEGEKVGVGEFTRSIAALSQQIADLTDTCEKTLAEARKTNGRVTALEQKLEALERSGFVTLREIYLVGGTLTVTVGVMLALVKWWPAFDAASKVAP